MKRARSDCVATPQVAAGDAARRNGRPPPQTKRFKQKKARQPAHNRRAVKKLRQQFLGSSMRPGSERTGPLRRRWLPKSGRALGGTAPAHMKGLQTKKSPAATAFAAQPLGDSLKTRRLSRFCPCGAAPCLLTRQALGSQLMNGL